jgi:hypothetical protein
MHYIVGSERTVTMRGQMRRVYKRYPVKKFLSRELSDLNASPRWGMGTDPFARPQPTPSTTPRACLCCFGNGNKKADLEGLPRCLQKPWIVKIILAQFSLICGTLLNVVGDLELPQSGMCWVMEIVRMYSQC